MDHFIGADKMVSIGSNTTRSIIDYKLSRYACYLIVLNCDARKRIIALAKTYFAIQTRKQELSEKEYSMLTEDEKRFYQRNFTIKYSNSFHEHYFIIDNNEIYHCGTSVNYAGTKTFSINILEDKEICDALKNKISKIVCENKT